ncbi:helix-turn-helix domain-containing protein [Flavobacterium aciduliphilum]|uniref:Helix-turn-helix protein n=1 Tax=Flavobacterium aciduliphilum TaxID=1101402 RepID=A0A328YPU7_9FLAO|nr:helix-turn-helix domain-containing protein [Flavobacterium aciduliphilum]RAR72547.1 helix-turn-helix protein [Flavobacterium aciduliphilum]
MNNKTVIRRKNETGKFTTIHNNILFDTRLTPNALRLFIAILSDSDTKFNLSQTVYCDRLGITKKTFFSAIANLEECGYLRKSSTKVKNLYHYTISEFGNLNIETVLETDIENNQEEAVTSIQGINNFMTEKDADKYLTMVSDFVKKNDDLIDDDFFQNTVRTSIRNIESYDSIVEKFEKYLYKKVVTSITDSSVNPKSFEEFKERAKYLIFKHKKYDADFMNTWTIYKKTRNIKQAPRDHETEMFDYHENPKD